MRNIVLAGATQIHCEISTAQQLLHSKTSSIASFSVDSPQVLSSCGRYFTRLYCAALPRSMCRSWQIIRFLKRVNNFWTLLQVCRQVICEQTWQTLLSPAVAGSKNWTTANCSKDCSERRSKQCLNTNLYQTVEQIKKLFLYCYSRGET